MVLPTGASSFVEAMRIGSEVYQHLKAVIKGKYGVDAVNVGDEGGFAPNIQDNKEGLELVKQAVIKGKFIIVLFITFPLHIVISFLAGYEDKVQYAMDCAASEFYVDGKYDLDFKTENNDGSHKLTSQQLQDFYNELSNEYNLVRLGNSDLFQFFYFSC